MLQSIIDKGNTYQGHDLHGTTTGLETACCQLVDGLVFSLERRFEIDGPILSASTITDLNQWPAELIQEQDFGDDSIATLGGYLRPALESAGVDITNVHAEWSKLKQLIYKRYPHALFSDLTWQKISMGMKEKCPNILKLVDLILTLAASSVEAERGFSLMKRVKSDWRSRLLDKNLSDLMMVDSLESPEDGDYDPTEAVHWWNNFSERSRRPDYMEESNDCSKKSSSRPHVEDSLSLTEMRAMEKDAFSSLKAALLEL